jgi:hypothetical protein
VASTFQNLPINLFCEIKSVSRLQETTWSWRSPSKSRETTLEAGPTCPVEGPSRHSPHVEGPPSKKRRLSADEPLPRSIGCERQPLRGSSNPCLEACRFSFAERRIRLCHPGKSDSPGLDLRHFAGLVERRHSAGPRSGMTTLRVQMTLQAQLLYKVPSERPGGSLPRNRWTGPPQEQKKRKTGGWKTGPFQEAKSHWRQDPMNANGSKPGEGGG